MCIIVDADSVQDLKGPTEDGKPVLRWLLTGRGKLVVGGKLKRELAKASLSQTMVVLDQAGRLKKLNDISVDDLTEKLKSGGQCRSNDCHILAAAIVSGCRLVFTKDQKLHSDAQNKDILDPPASIYQTKAHQHLLTECRCVYGC